MRPAFRIGIALALALCAMSARADIPVYYHAGRWDAFSGPGDDGKPVCGVGITDPTDGRTFSLRYQIGGDTVMFQAKKPGWNIPDNTPIAVVMQIGLETPWTLQGAGNGQVVAWTIDRNAMQAFDMQFRRASSMTLTFPAGNEAPWTLSLAGSTAISNALGRCVADLMQRAGAQPGAPPPPGNTQPFGQPSTQPSPPPPAPAPAPAQR